MTVNRQPTADELNGVKQDTVQWPSKALRVTQVDSSGNEIESHQDFDGEYYSGAAIIQAVHEDSNNSSTTNLTSANSYTFTGTASSTLGVAGLQFMIKTDQNATVYIEQSNDGTNWDVSDTFIYFYSKGGYGETVQAVGSYWRIRVILSGTTDTTYFRLTGILCPVVEALPRSLDTYGNLKTVSCITDCETRVRAEVEPLGSLRTITPVRLIGTSFENTTKDTNFWTETVTGTGSITQDGEVIVATGTTANSTAQYDSVRKARKVTGATNEFRTVARLVTSPQADNLRRIGAYDDDDGFFFQVNGLVFGVGSRKGSSDTVVNSGSFNGNYGSDVVMDTSIQRLVIQYTSLSAKFFVNGILLHTITGSTTSLTSTLSLPIRMENNNSGGNITNNSFEVRFASILRLGKLTTQGKSVALYANGTYVLKRGAGVLQRIINTDNAGSIFVYDNTTNSLPLLTSPIDTTKALGTLEFNAPFNTGLTIVVSSGAKITVIYE